jgi:hypothetical protein
VSRFCRNVRWAVVVATAGVATAACSALTSFDGLPAGAATDASNGGDAKSGDANGSSTSDSGVASDAPLTGTGFCATMAPGFAFCDDFDTPRDGGPFSAWDLTSLTSGGTVTIDTAAFVSSPASMLATSPEGGTGTASSLTKHFSGHTRTSVALDLRLDESDSTSSSLLEIHLNPAPAGYSDYRAALIFSAGKVTLDAFYTGTQGTKDTSAPVAIDFSSWHRVTLGLDTTPVPQAYVKDGTGALLATLSLPAAGMGLTEQDVNVGIAFIKGNTSEWRVRADNVAVFTGD